MHRVILFVVLVVVSLLAVEDSKQKVVFLDVGQGDAILLQDGVKQVLVDGGPGMKVLTRLGEEMPWLDKKIEVVIATHPDQDHLEGLLHVLERYEVDLVLLPKISHTSQLQAAWLDKLQDLVERKEIDYRFGWVGQEVIVTDELSMKLLGPLVEGDAIYAPGKKTNNASIVTRVDFGELSFLLTSDAEAVRGQRLGEQYRDNVLADIKLDVDVLKAGHHGSKTSTTAELLDASTPEAIVLSVGSDNRYGHPHSSVIERLEGLSIWRTDEDGSIRFVRSNNQWLLSCSSKTCMKTGI